VERSLYFFETIWGNLHGNHSNSGNEDSYTYVAESMPIATDVQDTQLLANGEDMANSASIKELLKADEEVHVPNTPTVEKNIPAVSTEKPEVSWFQRSKFKRYLTSPMFNQHFWLYIELNLILFESLEVPNNDNPKTLSLYI